VLEDLFPSNQTSRETGSQNRAHRNFQTRNETFDLEKKTSWAFDALRLAFAVPRVYQPMLEAWDRVYPGSKRAFKKLSDSGFLDYQDPVIVDTRTGETAKRLSMPVVRYKTNAKGKRLNASIKEDTQVLKDIFTRVNAQTSGRIAKFIDVFDLEVPHSRYGISVPHASKLAGLPERSGRWWAQHLLEKGYLVELDEKIADVREVVPAHYRVNRKLCNQLKDVIAAYPNKVPAELKVEFKLDRRRFLADIDPARVGLTGATDFDHDVETQLILARMLRSERAAVGGVFIVEPRIHLPVETTDKGYWTFTENPDPELSNRVFYQPDAELRERHEDGVIWRSIVEYERFQSRRDAWSHIERFLGWMHLNAEPFEPGVLRFVVDTSKRMRSYTALIEAFADHMLDNANMLPVNKIVLAVSSTDLLLAAKDPLQADNWARIELNSGPDGIVGEKQFISPEMLETNDENRTEPLLVLHKKESPYDNYFGRG